MNETARIFFCEDDENLGLILREFLQAKGYQTDLFPDGEAGSKAFARESYDLCILDVMMPKKDGFALAQEIRSVNPNVPIIFLTAKSMKEDVLEGFRLGGDDYLSKPFSMEELMFRIEAIMRRIRGSRTKGRTTYKLGGFFFDTQKQTLTYEGVVNKLTTKECELLTLLCAHANEVLERNYALRLIWVEDNYFNARSMDVYITKLRKLLRKDPSIEIINIHGKGYKLVTPQSDTTEEVRVI
jgi:DNA-binding response OmpR family regulator